jgi:hypothetical protein
MPDWAAPDAAAVGALETRLQLAGPLHWVLLQRRRSAQPWELPRASKYRSRGGMRQLRCSGAAAAASCALLAGMRRYIYAAGWAPALA